MKKSVVLIAILSIIAGGVMSSQAANQNNEKERGYISISTSANTEIAPDV